MLLSRIGFNKYRLELGLPWTYSDFIEIHDEEMYKDSIYGTGIYTNQMFASLHPVDIIPILPKIDRRYIEEIKRALGNKEITEAQEKSFEHLLSFLYKPEYKRAIEHYNKLLQTYGITDESKIVSYLRLYATDNTQFSESITTSLEEIPIKQFLDGAKSFLDNIPLVGKTFNAYKALSKSIYLDPLEFEQMVQSISDSNSFLKFVAMVADGTARGLKVDFPKVWSDTQYNRTLNLAVTLSTPYGHPEAVWKWVIAPFIALVLIGAPLNLYGFTGAPLYVRIRAYGQSDIILGAIQSITINRGGQNTIYNIYKQPTKIDLTITVVDLYSRFGADYTAAKMSGVSAKSDATNYLDASESPLTNPLTSQPTVSNLLQSFKPFKDTVPLEYANYINKSNIKIKKYTFKKSK